ncbi:hypothetical protein PROFUN_09611 [Planoprotostelium fungivorum]|uniref:Nudix hydrolase domain-containing protein n=1 Tax=Planoprotostelium fungivorum TaxID=1890364 RepID=A0A2P6MNV4_9EUKA|nr:hypothetical protein PROFUN_09611 [Planoprotostelium fungivorum]
MAEIGTLVPRFMLNPIRRHFTTMSGGTKRPISTLADPDRQEIVNRLNANIRYTLNDRKIHPRKASVLVPLTLVDSKPSLLFTVRAENLSSHKGEVSFPGGIQDPTDRDAIHCALRETEEELGLKPEHIEVLGQFNDYPSLHNIAVSTVIGFISPDHLHLIQHNPGEIQSVFTVDLDTLCHRETLRFRIDPAGKRGALPYFVVDGHPDIWGLTGYITHHFLKSILKLDLAAIPKATL